MPGAAQTPSDFRALGQLSEQKQQAAKAGAGTLAVLIADVSADPAIVTPAGIAPLVSFVAANVAVVMALVRTAPSMVLPQVAPTLRDGHHPSHGHLGAEFLEQILGDRLRFNGGPSLLGYCHEFVCGDISPIAYRCRVEGEHTSGVDVGAVGGVVEPAAYRVVGYVDVGHAGAALFAFCGQPGIYGF